MRHNPFFYIYKKKGSVIFHFFFSPRTKAKQLASCDRDELEYFDATRLLQRATSFGRASTAFSWPRPPFRLLTGAENERILDESCDVPCSSSHPASLQKCRRSITHKRPHRARGKMAAPLADDRAVPPLRKGRQSNNIEQLYTEQSQHAGNRGISTFVHCRVHFAACTDPQTPLLSSSLVQS